ncbi:high affinity immunoglobulin epsilon receptor subunit beta-like [Scyliorhinus canicula]|uniref:high affinity immunoglobulin epsilon receptor subunit beta-like n=1 Tax=Scyliorhinus canicula TaxID=7830 RepID=UPI0018F4C1DD|nr:high affinity immunoglobulin epsilon receptor subunit beta-like [Scyliorhinus canicula]
MCKRQNKDSSIRSNELLTGESSNGQSRMQGSVLHRSQCIMSGFIILFQFPVCFEVWQNWKHRNRFPVNAQRSNTFCPVICNADARISAAPKSGSDSHRSHHQAQQSSNYADVMYVDKIVEEGSCLKTVSLFVSRELKIFGITEIMIGIIHVLFGSSLIFVESYVFAVLIGVPWWTGIWYIISGSLVVDIINTSNNHLKQVILLMHIISSIAALIGTAAYFVSLYLMPPLGTNFFYIGALVMVFFLMVLSCLEFIIASMVLFLHCTLVVREIYAASIHRNLARPHLRETDSR